MRARRSAIVLVPIGEVTPDLLAGLAPSLTAAVGLPSRVGESIPVPHTAYKRQRGQYRGAEILAALSRADFPRAARLLGVIDADCYAPGLNFVFGQAQRRGHNAFIGLPRLRPSFYGQSEDQELFRERVLKEAAHELGHTYGLRHCPSPQCVMHFSNSLRDTDVKEAEFCRRCRIQLKEQTNER